MTSAGPIQAGRLCCGVDSLHGRARLWRDQISSRPARECAASVLRVCCEWIRARGQLVMQEECLLHSGRGPNYVPKRRELGGGGADLKPFYADARGAGARTQFARAAPRGRFIMFALARQNDHHTRATGLVYQFGARQPAGRPPAGRRATIHLARLARAPPFGLSPPIEWNGRRTHLTLGRRVFSRRKPARRAHFEFAYWPSGSRARRPPPAARRPPDPVGRRQDHLAAGK